MTPRTTQLFLPGLPINIHHTTHIPLISLNKNLNHKQRSLATRRRVSRRSTVPCFLVYGAQ